MDLDYKALTFAHQIGNSFGLIAFGIYSWISNRHKANTTAIETINKSIVEDRTSIEKRFTQLEADIKHALTHDDLELVYQRINEMASTLSNLEGHFSQINQGVTMIHQYLLDQGSGKK